MTQATLFDAQDPPEWAVLGVDVGLTGCVAALNENARVISYRRTAAIRRPGEHFIKKMADGEPMWEFLQTIPCPILMAFIEIPAIVNQQHSHHSNCSLWHSLGTVETVFRLLGVKTCYVQPQAWMRKYDLYAVELKKRKAVERATRLNPELGKLLVKDADIAEAVLIGRYGHKYQRDKYQC